MEDRGWTLKGCFVFKLVFVEMARHNSCDDETFPYNHEYYALLRFKENERFYHYQFQARSPQVCVQLVNYCFFSWLDELFIILSFLLSSYPFDKN